MSNISKNFSVHLHKALDELNQPKRGRATFLAEKLKISHTAATKWLKGVITPSDANLEDISKVVKKRL